MGTRSSDPEGELMAARRQDRMSMAKAQPRRLRGTARSRSPEDEVAVAIHEAGHATVAVLLGREIIRVSTALSQNSDSS
jgi:ATP-dependent Zn protease